MARFPCTSGRDAHGCTLVQLNMNRHTESLQTCKIFREIKFDNRHGHLSTVENLSVSVDQLCATGDGERFCLPRSERYLCLSLIEFLLGEVAIVSCSVDETASLV